MKRSYLLVLVLIFSHLAVFLLAWNLARVNPGAAGERESSSSAGGPGGEGGGSGRSPFPGTARRESKPQSLQGDGISYPYLSDAGDQLSSRLAHDCHLTDEQFRQAQSAFSHYWGQMAQKAAGRIMLDEEATESAQDGASVYRLPAMRSEEREALSAALKARLDEIGVPELGEKIMGGLKDSSAFGRQGANDVVFRLTPMKQITTDIEGNVVKESVVDDDYTISDTLLDPETGSRTGSGISSASELSESYGHIFKMPGR